MRKTKHFILFIGALLSLSSAAMQATAQDGKPNQDVTVVIGREQVRFTAQQPGREMRLLIFNAAGEQVYDSGPTLEAQINWQWRNANGEALKSGVYAYTLSLKEPGAETARERRGHFIVDRAADRDGADRLWITGKTEDGLGTELTAAQSDGTTVAGTSLPGERRQGNAGEETSSTTANEDKPSGRNATVAAANGTAGQIAKFTTGTDLGNSEITESATNRGNLIGIGTTNPLQKLHVSGPDSRLRLQSLRNDVWTTTEYATDARVWHTGVGGSAVFNDLKSKYYIYDASAAQVRMAVDTNGNVGVGTTAPQAALEVVGNWDGGKKALRLSGEKPTIEFADTNGASGNQIWRLHLGSNEPGLPGDLEIYNAASNIPIMAFRPLGRPDLSQVEIRASNALNLSGYHPFLTLSDSNAGYARIRLQNVNGDMNFQTHNATVNPGGGSAMYIKNDTGNVGIGTANPQAKLEVVGRTRTGSLEIIGGADFSEKFAVKATAKAEAGMVVSIDPANPGKLQLSAKAYDRRVAGIISGAGGVNPGMTMGQEGTLADGKHPVALSGRVYCRVDAGRGAIKPGDLLTTSPTPGHAMKVANAARAQGAIIGKAMTGLKNGKGLVLVLVTLQ